MSDRPTAMASAKAGRLVAMLVAQIDGGASPEAIRPLLLALGKVLAADAEKAQAAAARAGG